MDKRGDFSPPLSPLEEKFKYMNPQFLAGSSTPVTIVLGRIEDIKGPNGEIAEYIVEEDGWDTIKKQFVKVYTFISED